VKTSIKSLILLPVLFACLSLLLAGPVAAQNLVQDGSFELLPGTLYYDTGLMGVWTVSVSANTVGIYQPGSFPGANVTDGNQAFDLGMGGYANGNSLSQVLPTVAGQSYRLSFDWGSEYGNGTSAFVSIGDLNQNLIDSQRGGGNEGSTPWIVYSSSFLLTASGNDTLTFSEPADPSDVWGLVLDNISVVSVAPPQLTLTASGPNVIVSWPTNATGLTLQSTTNLGSSAAWTTNTPAPVIVNDQNVVTNPISGTQMFFRLSQ